MAKHIIQNQGKSVEYENVVQKFKEMGARVKFRKPRPRNPFIGRRFSFNAFGDRVRPNSPPEHRFEVDVKKDKKGEYFDILITDKVDIDVLNIDADDRHLLLNAKLPNVDNKFAKHDNIKALCGHDERHWFSSQVPPSAINVNAAKESLKPKEVVQAQKEAGVKTKNWNKRNNEGFIRQGEWFFIPTDYEDPDEDVILKNEPLILSGRRGGKPHIAQFAYRFGGTVVYVVNDRWGKIYDSVPRDKQQEIQRGMTDKERNKLFQTYPKTRELKWTPMVKDMTLYVKGTIRHPDHKTLKLKRWHKVVVNGEIRDKNVVFLD